MQRSNALAEAFLEAPKVKVDKVGLGAITWGGFAIGMAPVAFVLSHLDAWLVLVTLYLVVSIVTIAPRRFDTLATYNPSVAEFLLAGLAEVSSSALMGLAWAILYAVAYGSVWGITQIASLFGLSWQPATDGIAIWLSTIVVGCFAALYVIGNIDMVKEQLYPDRAWTRSVYYARTAGKGLRVYFGVSLLTLVPVLVVWLAIVVLRIGELALVFGYLVFQIALFFAGMPLRSKEETVGSPTVAMQQPNVPATDALPTPDTESTQRPVEKKAQTSNQQRGLATIGSLISHQQQTSSQPRATVVEAIYKVLQDNDYKVRISPRTGNPDIDSFTTNVDLLAHNETNAAAIQVKTNDKYSDPVDWSVGANLKLSAQVLATEVLPEEQPSKPGEPEEPGGSGGEALMVHPVLVLVGREPTDSLISFSKKEQINIIRLGVEEITAISTNSAKVNANLAQVLTAAEASAGDPMDRSIQASGANPDVATELPGVSQ